MSALSRLSAILPLSLCHNTTSEAFNMLFSHVCALSLLQVTHTVLVTTTVLEKLKGGAQASPFYQKIEQMLMFFKVEVIQCVCMCACVIVRARACVR